MYLYRLVYILYLYYQGAQFLLSAHYFMEVGYPETSFFSHIITYGYMNVLVVSIATDYSFPNS